MKNNSKEEGLFADFLKVFTGLLIGLASFQILAPLIWNYLSELLHLEKYVSYCVTIFFYFIFPCLLLLIWWFTNKSRLLTLFTIQPENNSKQLIKLLNFFFPLFILCYFLLLFFSYRFDNQIGFYSLQIVSTLVLLFVLFKVSLNIITNITTGKINKKRKYYVLISLVSFMFLLFIAFEVFYLSYRDKTKSDDVSTFKRLAINNKAEIYNAFRVNDF
jgi:hypothetical protein